jgi:hypothetical protein
VRLLDFLSTRLALTLHQPRTVAASPRLHLAAEQYHKSISKKKLSLALDESDKLLPREALGITMVRHGEDFADGSVFGNHGVICTISYFLLNDDVQQ